MKNQKEISRAELNIDIVVDFAEAAKRYGHRRGPVDDNGVGSPLCSGDQAKSSPHGPQEYLVSLIASGRAVRRTCRR